MPELHDLPVPQPPADGQLINFRLPGNSAPSCGVVVGGTVHALGDILPGFPWRSLQEVYEHWPAAEALLQAAPAPDPANGLALGAIELLPPSLRPSALYFAGFNYHDHVENMRAFSGAPPDPDPKSVGLNPWHNLKPPNSLCGSGTTVTLPTAQTDWEIELAVVIGRPARNVTVDTALGYLAGYTVGVDLSARDRAFRPHTPPTSVARMDWIAQKGFEGACPLGPWLTPARQIADPQNLAMRLCVNGVIKQDSTTRHMIFTVAEAVSHLSSMVLLSPGDIILTGTPAGTGIERGEALKPGDVLTAWIEGIGELRVGFA